MRRPADRVMPQLAALIALAIGVVAPVWFFQRETSALVLLCILQVLLCLWYLFREQMCFRRLTLSGSFVAMTTFVFGSRGIYIYLARDFSIVAAFGLQGDLAVLSDAMGFVVLSTIAFIAGTLCFERRALAAITVRARVDLLAPTRYSGPPHGPAIALVGQIFISALLAPLGLGGGRLALTDISTNAYVYALPMLVHGFNLYFFTILAVRWRARPGLSTLAPLVICVAFTLFHAFMLYNMTIFRGFYTIGIFTIVVVSLLVAFGRISVWFILGLVLLYPVFKSLGADRSLSNREAITQVLLHPEDSYSSEGVEQSLGIGTDLNMLDTFAASLKWDHAFRGYVLSYLYILVHPIPRSLWAGKPEGGVLSDTGYTMNAPYSPGLIGFINDDGGEYYLIVNMFAIGAFVRWCELKSLCIVQYEKYLAVTAALLLSSVVSVRYLPYQTVFGYMVLYVPWWVCDRIMLVVSTSKRRSH